MTYAKFHPLLLTLMIGVSVFLTSCEKDNNPSGGSTGQVNLEITDGPSDDPNVKAVFITIAEVKIDGQTFSGFSGKKTIDLLAYQQGNVAALGLGELEAGTYQNITLVLDTQTDANGNSPGCYVQTLDNVKHALSSAATLSVTTTKNFGVTAGSKTNLVLDFDLRKAVQYQGAGADKYDFVGIADLQTALRLVVKSEASNMNGVCQNSIINTEKLVVFVYKKGTYNRNVEIQSEGGVSFKNAVASSVVNSNGEFKVAFLESGDYELHVAAYKDLNSDDQLDFQGTLVLDSLIDLDSLQLAISNNLQLNLTVIGILP